MSNPSVHLPVLPARVPHIPAAAARLSPRQPWTGRYVRVVVTARCPLSCGYCHMEGDPAGLAGAGGLSTDAWLGLLVPIVRAGIGKLKFVGGEPLLRSDLPEIIAAIRAEAPDLDISLITSGVVPVERLSRAYGAGLSRCNVTIHGFGAEAFARRGGSSAQLAMRGALVDAALAHRRPLKLNFVYAGRGDDADLARLLDWAAPRAAVVGVLDDLGQPDVGSDGVLAALARLRREPAHEWTEHDPHSLPTIRQRYGDGLVVEVKTVRLGETAPWRSCRECAIRGACREGIAALRLTHEGALRPCMDRVDLGVSLVDAHRALGATGVTAALHELLAREAS